MNQNKFLVIFFILILLIPSLESVFGFSPIKELFEKRNALSKPEFSWSKSYPAEFQAYFNDNFGMRKTLIYLNSFISDKIFSESPDSRAVIGKEGWFYFDNRNSLLDAAGKVDLDPILIERGVDIFYKNWQFLKSKNIKYLLVISPDKSTVYPEFLPDYIKPVSHKRIDKFINALTAKYPDFPILDLRPIMLEAKKNEIVYHQTDTHWNRRGSHYGYVAIMKKLGAKPHPRSQYVEVVSGDIRGDISDIMGLKNTNPDLNLVAKFNQSSSQVSPDIYPQEIRQFHRPVLFLNKNKNLPRLFVYKDSFFSNLFDYVSEHFSWSLYVNEFPCDLKFDSIKKFHPNSVIQQFWEGRIEEVLKNCS